MPVAFRHSDIEHHLSVVQGVVSRIENDPASYHPIELERLKRSLWNYANQNFEYLWANFVQAVLSRRTRPNEGTPAVFRMATDRYKEQFRMGLQRAFAVAEDSINPGSSGRSIFQKVRAFLRARLGYTPERQTPEKVVVRGYTRATRALTKTFTIKLVPYLRLLFETIPANLEREWMTYVIKLYAKRKLYEVVGGVMHNSATVCRFCNGKVLDEAAYNYVQKSPELKVHIYHPNCRHHVRPVPDNFSGRVYTLTDVRTALAHSRR